MDACNDECRRRFGMNKGITRVAFPRLAADRDWRDARVVREGCAINRKTLQMQGFPVADL
jgi:hypothetical protein